MRLARRALRLARSLRRSGVLTRLDEPDEHGRRYVLTVDLPADFALNQPLAHFALAAFGPAQVRINDPGCVSKTFPGFFEAWSRVVA